jgi:hypothetical protein
MGCHISELPATKIVLLSAQRRLLQPWSQVAKTWVVLVHGTVGCAPSSGLYSNISATLTEAGTGSCLLEDGNQNNTEKQSVARNIIITFTNNQVYYRIWNWINNKSYPEPDRIHKQ